MNFIRSSVLMDYFLFIVCVLDVFLNLVSIFVVLKKKKCFKGLYDTTFREFIYSGVCRNTKI